MIITGFFEGVKIIFVAGRYSGTSLYLKNRIAVRFLLSPLPAVYRFENCLKLIKKHEKICIF